MMKQTRDEAVESETKPTFVEEAYFSGGRLNEAIDWCLARHDRELHCVVEGILNSTNREVRFSGRLLKIKKTVLTRRFATLVEEDLRKRKRGDLEAILTVGGEGATQEDVAATQITLRNYLKRNLSEDLYYDGRDLQQAVKDLEKMKSTQSLCTVWGNRASDKLPIMISGMVVGFATQTLQPARGTILPEGFLEVRVEPEGSVGDPKIYLVAQPQLFIGPRYNPNLTIIANKVYIQPYAWKESPAYRDVVEARNLTVSLKTGKKLVENVSFALEEGEMLAIIGESGAGKSTTVKALIGDIPSTGVARIAGVDSRQTTKVRHFFGYCPQDLSYMYETFTPLENIIAFGKQYDIPEWQLIQRGKSLLRDFGVLEKGNSPTKELSGGQQRRVSIAVALAHMPKVLLMDEPTSGLDPDNRNELWNYLTFINQEYGTSIIVITHYPIEAEFCDKVAVFIRGKSLVAFGSPQRLKESLPNRGFSVGVVLEEVDPRARKILEGVEGVRFVLQRGELLKVFTDEPLEKIAESCMTALNAKKIAVKIVKTKSVADMVDYYIAITRGLITGTIEK
ncbi:MAG: ATP-binding cassette domain-containing protein [Candidatus Thorarchaeota archaeon]|nr:ATP-binding cassette domain-containing protein [Candidatus Thorarchaeota archaeon]